MSDPDIDEIKKRLRDATAEFIEEVEIELDESAKQNIVIGEADTKTYQIESILWPSTAYPFRRPWDIDKDNPLYETAEWLWTTDNGYELELSDDEGEPIENPDLETAAQWYHHELVQLAGQVLDYNHDSNFDEVAFNDAFENFWKVKYSSGSPSFAIIPLLGFSMDPDSFQLSTEADWMEYEVKEGLDSITVEKMSDEVFSGILTFKQATSLHPAKISHFDYVCRVEYAGNQPPMRMSNLLESLFRIFKPYEKGVALPITFRGSHGKLYHHFDMPDFNQSSGKLEHTFDDYELMEGEVSKLQDFWKEYGNYLRQDTETPVSKPLRRFNQMYTKSRREDQILDCMIGIESTLVKDINGGYQFHIPARGTLLLLNDSQYDSEFTYEFMLNLYQTRNKIVHQDKSIEPIEICGEELGNQEYIRTARYLLAQILIKYICALEQGRNIHQTNTEVLHPLFPKLLKKSESILGEEVILD